MWLLSGLADRMEDDAVRQSLVILGCAVVAGIVLSSNKHSTTDPADLSVSKTVVRAAEGVQGKGAHHAMSSVYAPADSYLLGLLREETNDAASNAEESEASATKEEDNKE